MVLSKHMDRFQSFSIQVQVRKWPGDSLTHQLVFHEDWIPIVVLAQHLVLYSGLLEKSD